jgi:autotransporter-associated beta strand protein
MDISIRGLKVLALGLAVAAFLPSNIAEAASRSWTCWPSSGDWSTASCWSGLAIPGTGDPAYIGNGGTVTITQPGETCRNLTIGGTGSGTVQLNAGSLVVNDPAVSELIGGSQNGAFVQTGGTHSIANYLYLGNTPGPGTGSYTLSGGSLSTAILGISNGGPGSFTQSGGTCSVSSDLHVGEDTGSTGTYLLSGSGLVSAYHEVVGFNTMGTLTQSGGTNSVLTGLVLGENAGILGTYNLNGGLLVLGGVASVLMQDSGSASFNISGGTLRTLNVASTAVPMTFAGKAVFDTGNGTMTLSAALSGSGSLVKSGTGVLVLSGTNAYSGGTTVTSGVLRVLSPKSLFNGSNLTVGANASSYFGGPSAPAEALSNPQEVPEPSTLALLAVGGIGALGSRRAARWICRRV